VVRPRKEEEKPFDKFFVFAVENCTTIDGGWVWGVGCVPPQKNFGMFSFEMVHFDAFLRTF